MDRRGRGGEGSISPKIKVVFPGQMKGMALLMAQKGNHAGWNLTLWECLSWDVHAHGMSRAILRHRGLGSFPGFAGLRFGFLGMGVPHAGEEMHTHFWEMGSPTHRAPAKNKTGLTENKLIQHEEALKK